MDRVKDRVAVGYIRVSTVKQDKSGLSLEEQDRRLRSRADADGTKLDRVYKDDESAKDLDRPMIQEVLARIERGEISHLYVYKLDRLTRRLRDLDDLMTLFTKKNVALVSVTESIDTSSAMGRMMVNLIGLLAQWERETIGERTVMALDAKRMRGERIGGHRPYGWKFSGKKLVPIPAEQTVLERIASYRAIGMGYTMIASTLNTDGVRPARGGKWYASSVRGVVLRAKKGPGHT